MPLNLSGHLFRCLLRQDPSGRNGRGRGRKHFEKEGLVRQALLHLFPEGWFFKTTFSQNPSCHWRRKREKKTKARTLSGPELREVLDSQPVVVSGLGRFFELRSLAPRQEAAEAFGRRHGVDASTCVDPNGTGSKTMGYHFGVGAPPILEPILVGIGMFTRATIWLLTHGQLGRNQGRGITRGLTQPTSVMQGISPLCKKPTSKRLMQTSC